MTGRIVLFDAFGVCVTLRSVLLLTALLLNAVICLKYAEKHRVRPEKAAIALALGYLGLLLFSRGGYLLLDRDAPKNILRSGEILFLGLLGLLAGIRLYCTGSPKAFRRLIRLFAPPLFPFVAALYFLRDGEAGRVAARGGLFRYTDLYGLSRWNVPILQGTLVLLLLLAAYLASCLLKKMKFRIRALPAALAALSLLLPAEMLRDTSQALFLGVRAEALAMYLCLLALLLFDTISRLLRLPPAPQYKLLSEAAALVLPLAAFFALRGSSAVWCAVLMTLPTFVCLSPLFPFFRRPSRAPVRRRKFD